MILPGLIRPSDTDNYVSLICYTIPFKNHIAMYDNMRWCMLLIFVAFIFIFKYTDMLFLFVIYVFIIYNQHIGVLVRASVSKPR